jgi:hypothetical protein
MPLLPWNHKAKHYDKNLDVKPKAFISGYQFTVKGSPRHYDDVKAIIEKNGDAQVYFGEALAYERGAGVALWRIRAQGFGWLTDLYAWWAEMERTEPIAFTMHLYLPDNLEYPALDLRTHTAAQVEQFIRENAPERSDNPYSGKTTQAPPKGAYIIG